MGVQIAGAKAVNTFFFGSQMRHENIFNIALIFSAFKMPV